ncbi:MAG TPA: rod shape-determining protein MreC [Rhodobacteraceae bacterium]|nr:rod shape-determining protein MreC [Paracoccaceae bacterium]
MARDRSQTEDFTGPLRRLLIGVLLLCLLGLFLVWRIDNPRVERFRAQVIDAVVPSMDWAMAPVTGAINLVRDFQSYQRLAEQNRELRSELRQMRAWKEAALQLEQENARLLDLNNVRLDPRLTYVTGVVMADSGSPFRQSVLLNVGARDGIVDGWAAMDGIGLVGRISGTGQNTARVILLTDASSAIPALVQPSGQSALVAGDNSAAPVLDFVENPDLVRPGDRVITSGDGGVFPAGLLIGQVAADPQGRLRVRLAADYERLEFLRVLRHHGTEAVEGPGGLVAPQSGLPTGCAAPAGPAPAESAEGPADG